MIDNEDLDRPVLRAGRVSRTYDRVAFRSDRLPTAHFDQRFSDENLAFWVPLLVEAAQIEPHSDVLDVGCGTGGFARAIARMASARVTGCDRSERFIAFARGLPPPEDGTVEWVVGDAEELPFAPCSFDRVLLSLVLHQLARPPAAIAEAGRALRPDGIVLVRTIAPEDAVHRVPERYVPAMAAADAARMPPIETLVEWLERAGFTDVKPERHLRNKALTLADEERALRTEVRSRYRFVTVDELEEGIGRMRADAAATRGDWIDPRPTFIIVARKQTESMRPARLGAET